MAWEPDYVTVPALKSYLRIDDAADDDLLAIWATTASRAVDTFCHRQFGQVDTAEARVFEGVWDATYRQFVVEIDDLQDVTGLLVESGDLVLPGLAGLRPVNAPLKGRPYVRYLSSYGSVTITALWGWSAVPQAVVTATLLQASRFAARRDSPFGIAGSPSEGSEVRLLASLDPDLKTALGARYRREWWVA